jgi:hypothetical protein
MYVEMREDDRWEVACSVSVNRDYQLFGWMCGVRSVYDNQIVPIRGLPSDVSYFVEQDYEDWGTGAHSCSWMDQSEIAQLVLHVDARTDMSWVEKTQIEGKETRIVFWFDN